MKTVCIKIGGAAVEASGGLLQELGPAVKALPAGIFPIIVHGGGKDIERFLDKLDLKSTFIEGMRVTDEESVKIVQMVLSGDVNKRIVNSLISGGVRAAGFSGVDAGLFTVSKMLIKGKDIGFVGKIDGVSSLLIDICKQAGIVPVISPISRDNSGYIYNVNADLAAGELAIAIKADHLVIVSDVAGVKTGDKILKEIKISDIEPLIEDGLVTGGMVPKLRSAAEAVQRGVGRVHICRWNGAGTLKNEIETGTASGTVICL